LYYFNEGSIDAVKDAFHIAHPELLIPDNTPYWVGKVVGDAVLLVAETGLLIAAAIVDVGGAAAMVLAAGGTLGLSLLGGAIEIGALAAVTTVVEADAGAIGLTLQSTGKDIGSIVEKSKGSSSGEGRLKLKL
jgi:hypothetical protein